MTSPPQTVSPSMSVLTALSLMTQRRMRHLPVIESGRMVGFVSIGDLVKYRIDRIESEATDRKSKRMNPSHYCAYGMPTSACIKTSTTPGRQTNRRHEDYRK